MFPHAPILEDQFIQEYFHRYITALNDTVSYISAGVCTCVCVACVIFVCMHVHAYNYTCCLYSSDAFCISVGAYIYTKHVTVCGHVKTYVLCHLRKHFLLI